MPRLSEAPGAGAAATRDGSRLVRGPLTVGEPAPAVVAQLADGDLYRPDTIADGGVAYGLTVRAASVRGLAKRYVGGPRQDDVCLRRHNRTATLVVAVADGVSAAPRSDLGAALAVRHATAAVVRQLDGGHGELDWQEVFDHAAWALVEQHRRDCDERAAEPGAAAAMLATTLVVASISAEDGLVQAAAVGDSPALMLAGGTFAAIVAEPDRDDGLVGGATAALPRVTGRVRTAQRRLSEGDVLLVCTDGVSLPLGDGNTELGAALARELALPPDIVDFARLLDFSAATYDDDRTLVAVWPERCE